METVVRCAAVRWTKKYFTQRRKEAERKQLRTSFTTEKFRHIVEDKKQRFHIEKGLRPF